MSDAEFDDEAGELVNRILGLHGEERIAAACRGSANPAALLWLADNLSLTRSDHMVDLGAGLGGPAEWMRLHVGCDVVAAEPAPDAAAGAEKLFGLVTVQATAASSPFPGERFDAVLLLGVLSVVDDRGAVLREARRIGKRVGVLDYCAASAETLCVGGSRFVPAAGLAAEVAMGWEDVRVLRIDEPVPCSWDRAAERAHRGVPQPSSERDVVEAIEAGGLVPYAVVGR